MPERQILDAADRVIKRNNAIPVLEQLLEEQKSSNNSDKNHMFDAIKGVLINAASTNSHFSEFLYMTSFYKKEDDAEKMTEIIDEILNKYQIDQIKNVAYLALALQTAMIKGECDFIIHPEWLKGTEIIRDFPGGIEEILSKLNLKGELNSYDEGRTRGCVFHITK